MNQHTRPSPTPSHAPRRPGRSGCSGRSLALLLALLVGLVVAAGAGAPAQAAAGEPGATGWIRVGHLSPDTPKADVRLTPFEGGAPTTLGEAAFGDLSSYERLPVGLYTLSLVDSATPDADAMLSRSVEVREGSAATVIATGAEGDVSTTVLQDDLAPPSEGQAKVRLISAATDAEAVEASVTDGPVLARGLRTGAATGYAEVPAQTWTIDFSAADGTGSSTQRVPVEAGGVYTLVALDAPSGGLELRAVQDSESSTARSGAMPSGGVDTGAGGLAAEGGPSVAPTAALAGTGLVVAALLAAAALRRRTAP